MLDERRARKAIEAILQWPTFSLGDWPTPIETHEHPRLGTLLVKRDDLAGFGRLGASGVKARKLEGFLGYLQQGGYDEVIIPLANMTNLGHDLVPVLGKLGIALSLPIVNDPPMSPAQRVALFRDVAGDVELIGTHRSVAVARMALAAASARVRGRRPIAVLPSPGHPSAVIGAARGFIEMVGQCREGGGRLPEALFVSAAAGATVTGFALAESLCRAAGIARMRVFGVQVTPDPLWLWIPVLIRWTSRVLGVRGSLPLDDFRILRSRRNLVFGRFDADHERLCVRVRESFGLRIDPLYGGKSWSVMERHASEYSLSNGPVLFWHCGYTPDWEAFRLPGGGDVG